MATGPPSLRRRLQDLVAERVSPANTRRATRFERHTVGRLSWERLVRLNGYLEVTGRLATGLWIAFLVSLALGLNWRDWVEEAINSGRSVRGALELAILVPTLFFIAARSLIGFARWRIQRELWRRDVARLTAPAGGP